MLLLESISISVTKDLPIVFELLSKAPVKLEAQVNAPAPVILRIYPLVVPAEVTNLFLELGSKSIVFWNAPATIMFPEVSVFSPPVAMCDTSLSNCLRH